MAGYQQASSSRNIHAHSTGTAVGIQTYETRSLEEVEALVKHAIWSNCSQLKEINVDRSKSGSGHEMKLKYDNIGGNNVKEIDPKCVLRKSAKYWEYKSTSILYQNLLDTTVPVEVLEVSHTFLSSHRVIKLCHGSGYSSMNKTIQEALIQVRLASAYTCQLQDLAIRKGSIHIYEVELMMEKLD